MPAPGGIKGAIGLAEDPERSIRLRQAADEPPFDKLRSTHEWSAREPMLLFKSKQARRLGPKRRALVYLLYDRIAREAAQLAAWAGGDK